MNDIIIDEETGESTFVVADNQVGSRKGRKVRREQ